MRPPSNRMAECHPHKKHHARGMCQSCYALYKNSKHFVAAGRKTTTNTCGHPDRRHVAHGKCPACYARWVRDTNPKYSKSARRGESLKRLYGITLEQRDRIISRQGGRCPICRRAFSNTVAPRVDHCHESGRVRGVLCHRCNLAVGSLGDTEASMRRALLYFFQPTSSFINDEPMWW